MFKYFEKKKTKLAMLVGIMCFSFVAALTATFCWFVSDHKKDIDNGNVIISNTKEFEITSRVLEYSNDEKCGVEDTTDPYILEPYDSYIRSRNEHLAKLLEIELTFTSGYSTGDEITISIPLISSSTFSRDGETVDGWISNVIQFRMLPYSYTNKAETNYYYGSLDTSSDEKIYENIISKMNSDSTTFKPYTMIPESYYQASNKTGLSKTTLIFDTFNVPFEIKSLIFYIEFDYCKTFVNYFADLNDASQAVTITDITEGKDLTFNNDLKEIIISSRKSSD